MTFVEHLKSSVGAAMYRALSWIGFASARPLARVDVESPAKLPAKRKAAAPEIEGDIAPGSVDGKNSNFGAFYYFDDVLEMLDSYFYHLARLRKHDRDAFDLYSQVGGQILGQRVLLYCNNGLQPEWLATRPAFGAIHIVGDREPDDGGAFYPKLIYYQKLKGFENVEPVSGDIYNVSIFFDRRGEKARGVFDFYVHVDSLGSVRLLKQYEQTKHTVGKGRKSATLSRCEWRIPSGLRSMSERWAKEFDLPGDRVENYAAFIFSLVANARVLATDGVRVDVKKGNLTGVFHVAMERTAYFFKDREKVVSENGVTKRIFHATRAHHRRVKGEIRNVRLHFRGLREFSWKGYRVVISVVGLHKANLNEFGAAAKYLEPGQKASDHLTMKEVGSKLANLPAKRTA